jgi:hypothetical protein
LAAFFAKFPSTIGPCHDPIRIVSCPRFDSGDAAEVAAEVEAPAAKSEAAADICEPFLRNVRRVRGLLMAYSPSVNGQDPAV